tara:strand:- start:213 stop:482 length:270 start_codon:yes stop_codon:yes gene_type:complete
MIFGSNLSTWNSFYQEVSIFDSTLDVEGSWIAGHRGSFSTWNDPLGEPPEPPDIQIDSVKLQGVEVSQLLSPDFFQELEELTLEKLQEN